MLGRGPWALQQSDLSVPSVTAVEYPHVNVSSLRTSNAAVLIPTIQRSKLSSGAQGKKVNL